jgi:hypothetical protein
MQRGTIVASLSHETIPHAFFMYGLIFVKENQMVLSLKGNDVNGTSFTQMNC